MLDTRIFVTLIVFSDLKNSLNKLLNKLFFCLSTAAGTLEEGGQESATVKDSENVETADESADIAENRHFISLCEDSYHESASRDGHGYQDSGDPLNEDVQDQLLCYYSLGLLKENLYYILCPLKIEEFSLDPDIYVYHDLITDSEIQEVLEEVDGKVWRGCSIRSLFQHIS
jgi:hypothetical protein